MKTRALIIAVEDYPESTVTSTNLPGTISNAERFASWLEHDMKVPRSEIVFCATGGGAEGYTSNGATRDDIRNAVKEFRTHGRDSTDRLFLYVTGHGLSKEQPDYDEDRDVLLCSDFVDMDSGDKCVPLGELTKLLADGLGPGVHMWFVDMCRSSNSTIVPVGLGLAHTVSDSGSAKWFQLLSTESGDYASTDSKFIDALIPSLNGEGEIKLVEDPAGDGSYVVTFQSVAKAVSRAFSEIGRVSATRMNGTEDAIQTVKRAGEVETIRGAGCSKVPPIRLLCENDEVIFLGETNGQLPGFMKKAFEERGKKWKRIDILTIEDLKTAHRGKVPLPDLEQERDEAERFFKDEAVGMCDQLAIYRYDYVGTYGSFWTSSDGARRAHVSAKIIGKDIRTTPASDYVDFPHMRDSDVEDFFALARRAIDEANRIFGHP